MKNINMTNLKRKTISKAILLITTSATIFTFSLNASAQADYQKAMKAQTMLPQFELASINQNKEAIQLSRSIDPNQAIQTTASKPMVSSNEYLMRVTGAQLNKGVAIDTSAPNALVRISPVLASKNTGVQLKALQLKALQLNEMIIITPQGKKLAAEDAMGFKADSNDLQSTPFPEGTSVFKFAEKLGAGQFKIQSKQQQAAEQEFVVSVLEKNSPYQLKLQTSAYQYFAGQQLTSQVSLIRGNKDIPGLSQVSGVVIAPDGREFVSKFSSTANGNYQLDMPINLPISASAGLWELKVSSEAKAGTLTIKRDARLAFAYNPVTALVETPTKPKVDPFGDIRSNVAVEVTYAGRFEVKALLFAKVKGEFMAVMQAQSAQWLEVGNNLIELKFDGANQLLKAKGVTEFYLKNIVLTDQTRMSVFEQADSLASAKSFLSSEKKTEQLSMLD